MIDGLGLSERNAKSASQHAGFVNDKVSCYGKIRLSQNIQWIDWSVQTGRWHTFRRERSHSLNHQEDQAPQPSRCQHEHCDLRRKQLWTKVSLWFSHGLDNVDHGTLRVYKNIVNSTAKQGYRPDLRQEAVARASAVRRASRPAKDTPEKKARGAKARKAADNA